VLEGAAAVPREQHAIEQGVAEGVAGVRAAAVAEPLELTRADARVRRDALPRAGLAREAAAVVAGALHRIRRELAAQVIEPLAAFVAVERPRALKQARRCGAVGCHTALPACEVLARLPAGDGVASGAACEQRAREARGGGQRRRHRRGVRAAAALRVRVAALQHRCEQSRRNDEEKRAHQVTAL
jgi:hypothetical protein